MLSVADVARCWRNLCFHTMSLHCCKQTVLFPSSVVAGDVRGCRCLIRSMMDVDKSWCFKMAGDLPCSMACIQEETIEQETNDNWRANTNMKNKLTRNWLYMATLLAWHQIKNCTTKLKICMNDVSQLSPRQTTKNKRETNYSKKDHMQRVKHSLKKAANTETIKTEQEKEINVVILVMRVIQTSVRWSIPANNKRQTKQN